MKIELCCPLCSETLLNDSNGSMYCLKKHCLYIPNYGKVGAMYLYVTKYIATIRGDSENVVVSCGNFTNPNTITIPLDRFKGQGEAAIASMLDKLFLLI